jgi:hypothetical protein
MRDIRRFMRSYPSNMSVYGDRLLSVLARNPCRWDLFVAHALRSQMVWPLPAYKRHRGPMSWPRTWFVIARPAHPSKIVRGRV